MDTLQIPITDYAYLEDVSWDDYESLLEQAGERPIRFTYDNGRLEIMTLSYEHGSPKEIIGVLIKLLAIVLHIPFRSGGSITMKRKAKKKGRRIPATGFATRSAFAARSEWTCASIRRPTWRWRSR